MSQVDKDNVFTLIVNDQDPILARYQYMVYFLSEYEGEYVDQCLNRLHESMMWYVRAFDVDLSELQE
jgi:hypothetical protein